MDYEHSQPQRIDLSANQGNQDASNAPPVVSPPSQPPKNQSKTITIVVILFLLMIGIAGFLGYMYFAPAPPHEKSTVISSGPTVSTTLAIPSATPVSSSNVVSTGKPTYTWKTYSNELYRYSIQYPSTVQMTDSNSFVQFRTQNNNVITISATKTPYATITEYLADLDQENQTAWEGKPSISISSTKKTKINEFSVVEREEYLLAADLTQTGTYFKIGSYIITYSFVAPPGNEKTEDMKIYFGMRQTLKSISQPSAPISPTCIPRPACLDTTPRCMMPETENMCPAKPKVGAQFCGGIAGKVCPTGYTCKYDGTYPDAGGTCVVLTTQKYTCPENGWISCMPMLSEEGKRACSDEAMRWYEANCPNFEGAAF